MAKKVDTVYHELLDKYIKQNQRIIELTKENELLRRDNERLEIRRSALEWALVLAQSWVRAGVDKQIEDKYKTEDKLSLAQ